MRGVWPCVLECLGDTAAVRVTVWTGDGGARITRGGERVPLLAGWPLALTHGRADGATRTYQSRLADSEVGDVRAPRPEATPPRGLAGGTRV